MLLLEQFFTEYMPLSSGLSPNTTRSYKHAFRLLFQYVYQKRRKCWRNPLPGFEFRDY